MINHKTELINRRISNHHRLEGKIMKSHSSDYRSFLSILFFICLIITTSICAEDLTLNAPDGSTVTIYRDSYGVPHIVGDSEVGVFFGQGFACAQDRLYQMDSYRRAAEGRLAEALGDSYLDFDKEIRTMYYTEEERTQLFNSLSSKFQSMLHAYVGGVNTYLDSMAVNPRKYKPGAFMILPMNTWTINNSIAIMQFFIRNFGQFGGDELKRLQELQMYGQDWFDLNRPINDPNAPTTIPGGGLTSSEEYNYSGIKVRENVIQSIFQKESKISAQMKKLGLPESFGSFAVLITPEKSNSGNVMLLGCPQMGPPQEDEPQVNVEVELISPTLHVGGMIVTGLPGVIIGHNEYHAWSFTSGISDNCDVYIDSTQNNSYSKYYHNGEWLDFDTILDTIKVFGQDDIIFTHYRTIHGPVFGDDLENHQVYSMKMAFWENEMGMIDFVLGLARAKNFEEFEYAASLNPMSFNLFYAGKDQKVKYWHTGWYQDRTDGVDPRLPHKGDGSEEWGGLINFADLPQATDPQQGYFVNWNNKPVSWWNNGDNIAWRGSHRVTAVDNYVKPINTFTYLNLKDVPYNINDHGTYQQAIELTPTEIFDENILPPGQSDFIGLFGVRSPHITDQWELHLNWEFKDMIFGQIPPVTNVMHGRQSPLTFQLTQNYPNPFNPQTTIKYQLPKSSDVSFAIYNINGQLIKTLVSKFQKTGSYKVKWNAEQIGSGIYFYRIKAGAYSKVRKCMVLK
jgi:penicillin G amidase